MSSNDDFGIGPSLPRSSHTQILSEDERAARLLDAHEQAVKLFDMVTESDILRPGVRDSEATLAIRQLAAERFGVSRHWHKRIVRSGPNTLQPYQINPPDRTMTDDDIVFADFGPVFDNWEADFGRTWVIGNDPSKLRLCEDLAEVHAAASSTSMTMSLSLLVSSTPRSSGWLASMVGHSATSTVGTSLVNSPISSSRASGTTR